MTPQERDLIEAYKARLAQDHRRGYLDLRQDVDPADPDCRNVVEYLLDNSPDPSHTRKGLCVDLGLHEDSLRKFLANRFGPPFGLVERLMRLTGCHKPLYWLAARLGYNVFPRPALSWDRRRKPLSLDDMERNWLDIKSDLFDLRIVPGSALSIPSKKRGAREAGGVCKSRRRALDRIRAMQERLECLRLVVESVNPQIPLFPEEE